MPISAFDGYTTEHWLQVKEIISESLASSEFEVELVSDADDSGVIHKRIVNNLYDADIVVCDVSGKNPNVMFELGMRLAFDKPTVIIKDNKTGYSFDTGLIEHVEYPADLHYQSIIKFKENLKKKVSATYNASKTSNYTTFLGHFGEFRIAKIDKKEVTSEQFLIKSVDELAKGIRHLDQRLSSLIESQRSSAANQVSAGLISNDIAYGLGGTGFGGVSSARGLSEALLRGIKTDEGKS